MERKCSPKYGIVAFYNLFGSLNKNPFRTDENKGQKKSGFIDSGFVKTCDELVIGCNSWANGRTLRDFIA